MGKSLLFTSYLLTLTLLANPAYAQDEPKKPAPPEAIPAPKVLVPPTIIVEPHYPRTDTREVWQYYGLNSSGRFVPRVINTPYGYYYSRDLQPYPWAGTRPRAFLP